MAQITAAGRPLNLDTLTLVDWGAVVTASASTSTHFVAGPLTGLHADVTGIRFAYDPAAGATTGVATSFSEFDGATLLFQVTGASIPVTAYESRVAAGDTAGAMALILSGADTLTGSPGADVLRGFDGPDMLNGGAGDDVLDGGAGDDVLNGGPGADRIEGGAGIDQLVLTGTVADYRITHDTTTDTYTVADLRPGAPDGVDTVHGVEFVRYNTLVAPLLTARGQGVRDDFTSVLRGDPLHGYDTADFATLVAQAESGTLSATQVAGQVVSIAAATTSAATLVYQFFTGRTPTSSGLDYLVAQDGANASNLNSAYYQSFSLENRYINFAVNVGKYGSGAGVFDQLFGGLSILDAASASYQIIFGVAPTDAKIHAIVDSRVGYFAALGGVDAHDIGVKTALVGFLLAEAEKAGVGVFATANQAYLLDLAAGLDSYAVDLVGAYHGTPLTGG